VQPSDTDIYQQGIIVKRASAETVFDVEGGAGSSLKSEQKRALHVRGVATVRDDGKPRPVGTASGADAETQRQRDLDTA
jgi:hypothetical protein